jgi:hypothetical protein
VLDSDSDEEPPKDVSNPKEIEALTRRMEAQKLEADRTGELQRMQERQKRESARQQQRRAQVPARQSTGGYAEDLQDLNFGSISNTQGSRLPPPMSPDSERGSFVAG